MLTEKKTTRSLIVLLLVILIWYGLGTAAFSFSLGNVAGGAIELIVSIALGVAALEGRIIRLLQGRPVRWESVLAFSLVAVVLVYDAIQTLRLDQSTLLGDIYMPGVISIVRVVGLLLLTVALLWELGRLIFSEA